MVYESIRLRSKYSLLARRSDDFPFFSDINASVDCGRHQLNFPLLAVCAVWNLHIVLIHLHPIFVSADSRTKSKEKCQQLSARANARVKKFVWLLKLTVMMFKLDFKGFYKSLNE